MPRAQQEPGQDKPETRIEKGVDVKFSIDDLEEKRTTTWEGVRNHEAKKYLKSQMKVGHTCLFYASNCKIPGVTGLARVIKEGYPDFNAWDPMHPYYDPKSKQDSPTWFMVDVEFIAKFAHPVPLALLQHLASLSPSTASLPPALSYLSPSHLAAIAESALIKRGRLSVQPASEGFFEAVRAMGEKGGWEGWYAWGKKGKGAKGKAKAKKAEEDAAEEEDTPKPASKPKRAAASAKKRVPPPPAASDDDDDDAAGVASSEEDTTGGRGRLGGKRGAPAAAAEGAGSGTRSSKRLRGAGEAKGEEEEA
ncbi:hypothetical protein JCM10449v2_006425 [Rhodotorula kratochvilovae]